MLEALGHFVNQLESGTGPVPSQSERESPITTVTPDVRDRRSRHGYALDEDLCTDVVGARDTGPKPH